MHGRTCTLHYGRVHGTRTLIITHRHIPFNRLLSLIKHVDVTCYPESTSLVLQGAAATL